QARSLNLDLVPTAELLIQKPIPLPSFIGGIHPKPGGDFLAGEKLCLSLFPGALMKSGDIYHEFREYIGKNTSFLIDNRPLPFMTFVELSYPAGGTPQVVKGQEV